MYWVVFVQFILFCRHHGASCAPTRPGWELFGRSHLSEICSFSPKQLVSIFYIYNYFVAVGREWCYVVCATDHRCTMRRAWYIILVWCRWQHLVSRSTSSTLKAALHCIMLQCTMLMESKFSMMSYTCAVSRQWSNYASLVGFHFASTYIC